MKKSTKKTLQKSKKPIIIGAICAGVAAIGVGLVKAFKDMKAGAKAQHEVDKANLEAVKAESKANFEENRGHNTYAKAKADAKQVWDDAHMTPAQRAEKMQAEREQQIADAKARTEAAEERIENAKKSK